MAGCLQTTFCVFNAIIAVLAAACVGIGAWALAAPNGFLADMNKVIDQLPEGSGFSAGDIQSAAVLIVIIGSVILLIAGIGCFGAWKDSKCLLGTFFIAMLIVCALVVAVVVLLYAYPGKISEEFKKAFNKYIDSDNAEAKKVVESFENTLKCCGVDGPSDYKDKGKTEPEICKTNPEGCAAKLKSMMSNIQSPVAIVAIITLVLLALATAISGYLYCTVDGRAV